MKKITRSGLMNHKFSAFELSYSVNFVVILFLVNFTTYVLDIDERTENKVII